MADVVLAAMTEEVNTDLSSVHDNTPVSLETSLGIQNSRKIKLRTLRARFLPLSLLSIVNIFSQRFRGPQQHNRDIEDKAMLSVHNVTWPSLSAFGHKQYGNMRLSLMSSTGIAEAGRATMKVFIPAEQTPDGKPISRAELLLGARTLGEGGSMADYSTTQIESFCEKHLIDVEVKAESGGLVLELRVPCSNSATIDGLSSFEAALQVCRD